MSQQIAATRCDWHFNPEPHSKCSNEKELADVYVHDLNESTLEILCEGHAWDWLRIIQDHQVKLEFISQIPVKRIS